MPVYTFECPCGETWDELALMSERTAACPRCGDTGQRIISPTGNVRSSVNPDLMDPLEVEAHLAQKSHMEKEWAKTERISDRHEREYERSKFEVRGPKEFRPDLKHERRVF